MKLSTTLLFSSPLLFPSPASASSSVIRRNNSANIQGDDATHKKKSAAIGNNIYRGNIRHLQSKVSRSTKGNKTKSGKAKASKAGVTTTTTTTVATTGATTTTMGATTTSTSISTSTTTSTTTTGSTGLVPVSCTASDDPEDPNPPPHICLQNADFGVEDTSRFNIDILLELQEADVQRETGWAGAFANARNKWMEIITGDLPPRARSTIDANSLGPCTNGPPTNIDDMYICGRDVVLDGGGSPTFNLWGTGQQLWIRGDGRTVVGNMRFDKADIQNLIDRGIFESLVLHEAGHVMGIGTGWQRAGLVDGNFIYQGQNAIDVWRNDFGCAGEPWVEQDFTPGGGTHGVHWDENCLELEFMTGILQFENLPISKLSIATVEDLGYEVDYSQAEDFVVNPGCCNPTNPTCCNPTDFSCCEASNIGTGSGTPSLSEDGMAAAIAYGKQILEENKLPAADIELIEKENDLTYMGDKEIVVYIEQNGHVYDVVVRSDE